MRNNQMLNIGIRGVIFFIIILLLSTFLLSGCDSGKPSAEPVSETRFLMDTVCTITIYGAHEHSLFNEAFDLCAEYEAMLSITAEGSDIWRVNHAGGASVSVSPQTIELLKLGVEYGEFSGGKFDISVGRLSTLWDFSGNPGVPSYAELEFARGTADFKGIIIDGDTVKLSNPESWLDLGAFAKGYIADRLADFLKARGVAGAVVEFGGDISIVGAKPDGSPWRIGVRQPFGELYDLIGVVELGESGIVTSGIYERNFEENGVLYHHILDPFTGMPSKSDVISATLASESAALGDILSTVAILAGSEAAAELLPRAPGFIGAVLVLENGELLQIGEIAFQPL